jgi:hypothetical protein
MSGNATTQELGGIGATEPVDSRETAGPATYSFAVTALNGINESARTVPF